MKNRNIIITTILLALGSLALPQRTQAVSPAPDGFYPGLNTAEGQNALLSLTTGSANTAVGWFSLKSNTEGSFNTATGAGALLDNTADNNTAFGAVALLNNTSGTLNTAVGAAALLSNTTGGDNTATGTDALYSNTDASFNTATGFQALKNNTGERNTATGADALLFNTDGNGNTAVGNDALRNLTTTGSNDNIALGHNAGSNLTGGSENIYLGSLGVATESNTIRIGESGVHTSAFIRGIRGATIGGNAVPVLIDGTGQLGTISSSRRYKKDIKAMEQASKAILSLKPVTFHYKSDTKDTPQFGLIAEEVAEVNPDLVVRDEKGEIYTVRYEAVNAMLLNEFLKEHKAFLEEQRKVAEQQATIVELKSAVAQQQKATEILTAQLKEQGAQIENVSAQLRLNKPMMQTVSNSH